MGYLGKQANNLFIILFSRFYGVLLNSTQIWLNSAQFSSICVIGFFYFLKFLEFFLIDKINKIKSAMSSAVFLMQSDIYFNGNYRLDPFKLLLGDTFEGS